MTITTLRMMCPYFDTYNYWHGIITHFVMTYLGTQCKDKLLECFILLQQLSPWNLIEKDSLFVERQKSSEVGVISIFSAWLSLNGANCQR